MNATLKKQVIVKSVVLERYIANDASGLNLVMKE